MSQDAHTLADDLRIGKGDHVTLRVPSRPFNAGAVEIVLDRPVLAFVELTPDEIDEIAAWIGKIEEVMLRVYNPQGINIGFSTSSPAEGDPQPFTVHVVPRWTGDENFMPVVAKIRVLPQSLAATARIYRDALFPS